MSESNVFDEFPQTILKYFSDGYGKVYCCRRKTGEIFSAKLLDDVADQQRHTPTDVDVGFPELAKQDDLATKLKVAVEPVIKSIVDSVRMESHPCLTPEERVAWDNFYCFQIERTQVNRMLMALNDVIQDTVETLREQLGQPPRPPDPETVNGSQEAPQLTQLEKFSDRLKHRRQDLYDSVREQGLVFWLLENGKKSFVLGDVPVVEVTPPESIFYGGETLMLFPIASDVAVANFGWYDDETKAFMPANNAGTRLLRQINSRILAQSSMIASHSRELVTSLKRQSH